MSLIGRDPYAYMPELETPRLQLRKLTMRDARDVFAYSRDPEVARHVLWDAQPQHRRIACLHPLYAAQIPDGRGRQLGDRVEGVGRIIGTIGFMWIQFEHASAEVGYSLARDMWGQGIMTEALREVICYAFETLRLNRVEAIHEVDNPASGAVMRKCGMRYEGCLRQKLRNKGRYVDVDLYAILRSDPRPGAKPPR